MSFNPVAALVRHQPWIAASRRARVLPSIIFIKPTPHSYPRSFNRLLLSTSPAPITRHGPPAFQVQRRNLWSSASSSMPPPSYSHLAHLEQTANKLASSASAQNVFYTALLRANRPDLVVQRYETGRFATNPACDAMYMKAAEKLSPALSGGETSSATSGGELSAESLKAVAESVGARVAGGNATYGRAGATSGAGSKKNPVHVVLEESTGLSIFRWVRFALSASFTVWLVYVLVGFILSLFSGDAGGLFRRVGPTRSEIKPEVQKSRFSDVHGCEEAKEELQEIVDFLKSPEKYSTLGGKLPKGILLVGPPGTGKTLLARAVAGEAGVPFFYMSGSEFDEIYVGVGAKRVRELFNAARTKAPAIVFIDELDAIGGKRNERDAAYAKQTLNQLLTDLDGFNQSTGVIFLAATNFPELLDSALTRPGRFDRQVVVGLPDVRGRIAILQHYIKKMSIDKDVDATIIARGTPGFSGADLENLTNSAAIHASKRRAKRVEMIDFEWAKDRILMGAERKSAVIQQKDKIMTAYHEGGHALVAMFTPYADPLYKATIMPRGHALGVTFQLPEMDKVSMAKREFIARMDVCMGGKVAEEMVYGPDAATSGASSDIQQATSVAYAMVTQMGMSSKLGNVDLHSDYGRLPPETKQVIWEEVRRLVEESKSRAEMLLHGKRTELDRLATALVEYETLGKDEMELVVKGGKLPEALKGLPDAPVKLPDIPISIGQPQPPLPPGGDIHGVPGHGPGEKEPGPSAHPPPGAHPVS